MNVSDSPIPPGLCQCGCGQKTKLAKRTRYERGHVKGQPLRYVNGHNPVVRRAPASTKICTTCGREFSATPEHFHRNGAGLRPYCKPCAGLLQRERRAGKGMSANGAEYQRMWRKTHPAYREVWRKAHREECRGYFRNHEARKLGNGGTHTAADIKAQYSRQKGRCFYCGGKVGGTYHTDHVIPLVLDGSNGPENLVIACPTCNLSKGAKHPMDFDGRMF